MKRQQTMAAVLVAALLVLALVVVLVLQTGGTESTSDTVDVWDLTPGAVGALFARGADGTSLRMEKDGLGTWYIVEPALGPADQNRLNWLVEDLAHLESVRRFDPGQVAPAESGLDAPAFTLVIGLRGGGQHVLEVGHLAPTGYYYYVQVDGALHLCPYDVIERTMRLVTIPPLPTVPGLWPTPAAP